MMEATAIVQGVAVGFVLGYLAYFITNRNAVKVLKGGNYKFVMVVRTDLSLNKNQTAVHCSRAALECYKKGKLKCPEVVNLWEKNSQPKIVLKLDKNGNDEIMNLHRKAESLGIISVAIMEECNTEAPNNFIVLGIGPASEELINEVTGHLKLLG